MLQRNNYVKFLLLLAFLLVHVGGWAQKRNFNATVIDSKTSEPLIGVSVVVKDKPQAGTVTDLDGHFTLTINPKEVILISYVGYTPLEIPAGKVVDGMTIKLEEKKNELSEVVVVGYGVQKKVSTVAAITQTKGSELLKTGGVTSVTQALQGLLPGVVAVADNSKPGADAGDIFIRGKSSWDNSSPLILVDGIERDFNDVDPNEIETISTLKDASATAVYGVKGANGVILITTKRGTNDKPSINFSANFGFKQPTTKPSYADYVTTLSYWNEALRNDNQWSSLIPQSTIEAWKNAYATGNYGPYNEYFPEVNWWDEAISKWGYQQNYNVNVSGGTDFVGYFISLGYLNDGDIFKTVPNDLYDPSFGYKRYNWRTNFDFNVTKTTKIGVNLAGKFGYRNQAGYRIADDGEDGFGQAQFFQAFYSSPRNQFPIRYSDGYYGVGSSGTGNAYANLNDLGQRTYKYFEGLFDLTVNQKLDFLTKGLSFKGTLSYTTTSNTTSRIQHYEGSNFGESKPIRYYRTWDYAHPNADGTYPLLENKRWPSEDTQDSPPSASYDNTLTGGSSKRLYYELAFNYARTFGNHDISLLALVNRQEVEGLASTSTTTLRFPSYEEAWVGRATYSWQGRYLAEVNAAYTGSEKFAPGKRFGFFPSFSAGWRVSEEPFIKKYTEKFLTNLKLRYSYGVVGSDKGSARFNYIQTYNLGKDNVNLGTTTSTAYGPLYTEGAAANPDATWETAHKQNFGLDLLLWDKLSFTMDVFREKRTGILMTRQTVPIWFGIKDASANIGETKNQGAEFEIGWKDRIKDKVNYWVKANLALSENRVVFRDDPRNTPDYQKNAGKPIGWESAYLTTGNYQSLDDIYNYATPSSASLQGQLLPGDFMYADYNADGVINSNDLVPLDKLDYPLTTYGFSFGGSYKNFDLSVVFYGAANLTRDLPSRILWDFSESTKGTYIATPEVAQRWSAGAAGLVRPTLHSAVATTNYNQQSSTYTYQDYGYLRLKSVELGYTLPQKIVSLVGLKKMQVYVNGSNLLTLTNLTKKIDPETKSADVYPLIRRYNIGFRIDL